MPWKIEWSTITTILDRIESEVMAIEGVTWQYAKSGTPVAEIGQACSWALELNTDFAPPTTTEIEPGNYQIDQIRGAVTTNIVASTPASESAGTIYANYTPAETDWNIGDLVKVTFSGGYVRTDQTPTEVLTVNATAGNDYVEIDNTEDFMVGWLVRVYDDVNGSEWMTISAIPSATKIEFSGNLSANHTTANNAGITRAIRQDLSTAIFFTMLQNEAQSYKIIASGTLDTSSAIVPADSTRTEGDDYFNGNLLMMKTGTVANQPKLIVDYTGTGGIFAIEAEQPFTQAPGLVEYVVIATGAQLTPAADSANNQTPAQVLGNKESAAVFAASITADVIAYLKGILASMTIAEGTFTTSSATVPADTGRAEGNDFFNGTLLIPVTGADAFQPRLIVDFTTTTGVFTVDPEHPFTAATGLVDYIVVAAQGDLVPAANSTNNTTVMDVVGNKGDTETADDMSALATASVVAEVKRLLIRMSTDAFTATIQGSARVELDTMLGQLATYLSAAGAAWSVQVNNNTARTNLEQVLEDYFGVIGCDDANVFNPDIQGSARTTLDAALAAFATYIAASGAAYSVQINNQTARTNIEQTLEDFATVLGVNDTNVITNINNSANATFDAVAQKFAAVLGCDSANVFNPTVQGSTRTTVEAAIEALASYFAVSSAAYSAKVNNQTLRTSLEAILQDYFAVVGCDGTNAFGTAIQGSSRTTIEAAFDALATYFCASGAAPSKKVNNLTLRTNFEDILQDLFSVVGCDGANTFSVTAQGASQTVLDTALDALAQYFATSGAAISATVNPGGSVRATLELILEDIGDMLAGSAGIVTWPGSVKYGNGVSMAEAVAYVSDTADTISGSVSEGTLEITEDNGSSTTVITASEITQGAGFWKGALVLCTSGDNDGQTRPVVASVVGSVTVFPAFGATVDIADTFLLISAWRPDVWNQQPDAAITFDATNVAATVLDLSTAGYSYMVNSLRIKVANPGAQTVTFSLCEVVNDVAETVVDTFAVDSSNYTLYHSLADMFSLSQWAGDDLKITAVASDAGPYAVTGQYQYALARTA